LRRVLEPDRPARAPGQVIAFSDAGYRLVIDPDAVDAVALDRRVISAAEALRAGQPEPAVAVAAAALGTWRGEPLAGIPGPWFAAGRDRLGDVRARAVETWAAGKLALGRPEAVVAELAERLAAHPLRERCCELLMLALHRSGRTAESLEVYRRARENLVEQTGLEPSAALSALQHQLLAGNRLPPDVRPPDVRPPDVPPPDVPPPDVPPPDVRPLPPVGLPPGAGFAPPVARRPPARPPAARVARTALRLLLSLVPVISVGIATWPVIGLFAVARRSVRLAVATAGDLVLTVVGFLLLGPDHPSELNADVGTLVMLGLAFGGCLHAAALAFRLGHPPSTSDHG
jgi:Bacterial transcriptional activator domain